jgi:hypothetical protein
MGCQGVLFGALLLGCDGSSLDSGARITGLHFTTTSAFPENPAPTNVDVTLSDEDRSRAVFDATLALPAFPPGRIHCPSDPGYGHKIVFMDGQTAIVTATLNSGGCRDAAISGAPPVRQTTEAFWVLLAQKLGVDQSTFFSLASP